MRSSSAQVEQMDMLDEAGDDLAHDFNNVVYSIVVALNLMQRRIAAGRHEEVGQYVDAAFASAHRATSLASRLLAFARRQSLGTTVDVTAAESSESEHEARRVAQGVGETVLVVEDEPQLRALVHEVLSELGYETLEAGDAPDALAQLENHNVDLLISDFGLPGLNGRQLAEMARLRSPDLPVLFMTGHTEYEEVRSTFLDTGMDLVTKPFEIDAFATKVRSMMAQ